MYFLNYHLSESLKSCLTLIHLEKVASRDNNLRDKTCKHSFSILRTWIHKDMKMQKSSFEPRDMNF
uniref:Uncharacterized protein n=1 Tax=Octopus bimaculoides TaxID=37653 RepID=A0A0L8G6L8_OCTBM